MRPLRARFQSEQGLGLVEVLVAVIVLVGGALATFALVGTAHRQTFRAEQSQVVSDRLQAEMEAVKRLEYRKIALTSTPAPSTDPASPNHRVSTVNGVASFALNENGTNPAPIVANNSESSQGVIDPGPTEFASGDLGTGEPGDITGRIYRYVTWMNDPNCPETTCPGGEDFKRVTIAIELATTPSGGERAYQEIQSDLVDGTVAQVKGAAPPPPTPSAAVPYSLSDTPCTAAGPNPRQAPSSHDAHNTLGSCASGMQSGDVPGAPDRLYHAERSPVPSGDTGSHDFSTDVLTQEPSDEGLQMPVQPKQCDYAPIRSTAGLQVHRWVTAPVTGGEFVLDGTASLSLYSKTINDAAHTGRLCIWLFVRQPTSTGGEADNLITNAATGNSHFTYSAGAENWRSGQGWGPAYQIPLAFEDLRLGIGDRLGLAIAVDAAGTPGEALQFRYNHPAHDSVLQVYTTTKATAPD